MTVYVDVVGQTLIVPNRMVYIEGTQEFIRFTFNLDDDWKELTESDILPLIPKVEQFLGIVENLIIADD